MRNINNPAFHAERLVLLSDKNNLVLSGKYWSSLMHLQMSIVLCLQRFPMKIENCHNMAPEAATRTPEAGTLAALLLPEIWEVLVLPNWDNTSADSLCSTAMFTLSELTHVTRVVLRNTLTDSRIQPLTHVFVSSVAIRLSVRLHPTTEHFGGEFDVTDGVLSLRFLGCSA